MKRKVFIIDDDSLYIAVLTRLIGTERFTVDSSSNHDNLAQKIKAFDPDVLLIDLVQPLKYGDALAVDLKAQGVAPSIPVLLISSSEQQVRDLVRDEKVADGYIIKSSTKEGIAGMVQVYADIGFTNKITERLRQ